MGFCYFLNFLSKNEVSPFQKQTQIILPVEMFKIQWWRTRTNGISSWIITQAVITVQEDFTVNLYMVAERKDANEFKIHFS